MIAYARLLLKLPYFTDEHGVLHVIAGTEVPAMVELMAETDCQHRETICSGCADQWNQDYDNLGFVVLTDDGPIDVPWGM